MRIVSCRLSGVFCWALGMGSVLGQESRSFTNPDSAWGKVGSPFSLSLQIDGEAPGGFAGGGFPPGITLDSETGSLRGTPLLAGDYHAHLAAVDDQRLPLATQTLRILVYPTTGNPPPPIEALKVWGSTVGESWRFQPHLVGDPEALDPGLTVHWHDLPPGLTFDSDTHFLEGTPTTSGIFSARLVASNPFGTTETTTLWTIVPRPEPVESISGVTALAFHESRFVAAGPGFLRHSEDGRTWQDANRSLTEFEAPRSIAYGMGRIVVPGRSRLLVSGDALQWEEIPLGADTLFTAVVHGDDGFVAMAPLPPAIWRSNDGANWLPVPWEREEGFGSEISVLMHAGGVYLAVTEGGVYASADGIAWARATEFPAGNEFEAAYSDGQFYLVEPGNARREQWTSRDGFTWARGVAPPSLGAGPIATVDDFRAYLLAPRSDTEVPYHYFLWRPFPNATSATDGEVSLVGANILESVLPPVVAPQTLVAVAGEPVEIAAPRTAGEVTRIIIEGLPEGLAYDEITGVITGTTGQLGVRRVSFVAEGPGGASAFAQPDFHVVERSQLMGDIRLDFQSPPQEEELAIGWLSMSDAPLGGSVHWEVEGVPPGLDIEASTGRIIGTPLRAGIYPVTIRASHPLQTSTWTRNIRVRRAGSGTHEFSPTIAFDAFPPPRATKGAPYDYTLPIEGPYDELIVTGMLPPGLRFEAATGRIVGVVGPEAEAGDYGNYQVIVEAAYQGYFSAPYTVLFSVLSAEGEAPSIADSVVLAGMEGERVHQPFPVVATGPDFALRLEGIAGELTVTDEGILSGRFPAPGRYDGFIHASNVYGTRTSNLVMHVGDRVFTEVPTAMEPVRMIGGPGGFAAASIQGGILVSPDGMSWERVAETEDIQFRNIRHLRDRWFATGAASDNGRPVIMLSNDGLQWRRVFPDSHVEDSHDLEEQVIDITDGPLGLIAVGNAGSLFQSTDGENWTVQSIARAGVPVGFYSVAFGNGRYVAALADGGIMSSVDGRVWQDATLPIVRPDGFGAAKVTFGLDAFWVAGNRRYLLRSEDGVAWSVVKLPIESGYFTHVNWHAGDLWVSGDNGLIMHTNDGATWHDRSIDVPVRITGIAFREGRYLVYSLYRRGVFVADAPLPSSLSILPPELEAIAGEPQSIALNLSQPATRTMVHGLPSGMVWDEAVLQVRGTPEEPGTFNLTYVAEGPSGTSVSVAPFTVEPEEIDPPELMLPPVTILSQGPPGPPLAIRGLGRGSEITVSGLPKGIFLAESTLTWSGIPLEYGRFDCHLRITNRAGVAEQSFVLWTQPNSVPVESTLPPQAFGVLGEDLSYSWADGGLDFDYEFDSLPPGVVYDPISRSLQGRPAETGTFQSVVSIRHPGGVQREFIAFHFVDSEALPPVLAPAARIDRVGDAVRLRWPVGSEIGWSLETSEDLLDWRPLDEPVQVEGDDALLSIPLEGAGYFRWRN